MSTQIATQIRDQIGHRALYMIGAKNIMADENALVFKIGRNSKGINHVKITLNPMDTYDMEFKKVTMNRKTFDFKTKMIKEYNGVYNDQLKDLIEEATGLCTSL